MERRKFLESLGLGSLVVATSLSPFLAHAVDKGIQLNFKTADELLNQELDVWRYRIGVSMVSNPHLTKGECQLDSLLDLDEIKNNDEQWEEYGGTAIMSLSNFAYSLIDEGKFELNNWDSIKVGNFIQSKLPEIFSEKITLKQYLEEMQDGYNGYIN